MLKESITIDDVCNLLNEMLEMDYECVSNMVSHYSKCNESIMNHPTIQVRFYSKDDYPQVGLIGFLNGLFGIQEDGMGALCMEVDEGKILRFRAM